VPGRRNAKTRSELIAYYRGKSDKYHAKVKRERALKQRRKNRHQKERDES
jgi:hypothetical protein